MKNKRIQLVIALCWLVLPVFVEADTPATNKPATPGNATPVATTDASAQGITSLGSVANQPASPAPVTSAQPAHPNAEKEPELNLDTDPEALNQAERKLHQPAMEFKVTPPPDLRLERVSFIGSAKSAVVSVRGHSQRIHIEDHVLKFLVKDIRDEGVCLVDTSAVPTRGRKTSTLGGGCARLLTFSDPIRLKKGNAKDES